MRRSIQSSSGVQDGALPVAALRQPGAMLTMVSDIAPRRHIGARRFAQVARATVPVVMTAPMRDHVTIAEDMHFAELERMVQLSGPTHYRSICRSPFAIGFTEFCAITDGFFAFLYDVEIDQPYLTPFSAPGMLRIRVTSESDVEHVTAQGDVLDMQGPSATIIIEPTGGLPAQAVTTGRNRGASVYIDVAALKTLFVDSELELPALLHAFLVGDLRQAVARRLALAPALLRCAEDLVASTLQGRARRLFIQSKAVEMLCHAFEALAQDDGAEPGETSVSSMRGVLKAQKLLADNFITPPTLEDLAHEVGMSRSNLCAAFRQTVGQTVYDYVGGLRMQRALALLHQPGASITQIAYDVGYTHPSSFTVAVQRRFGVSPRELRRRALPNA
jgi:AraC family transcriptional activator of pyochelin receptor